MANEPHQFPINSRVVLLRQTEHFGKGAKGIVRATRTLQYGPETYIVIDGSGIWMPTADLQLADE